MRRPGLRARLTASAITLALLIASCGGDDDNDASPERSTPTTAETTTTEPAVGPEEWVEVARDLYQRNLDLLADPDPDRVSDLYAETCECWDASVSIVEALANDGHHVEGQPTSVLFVNHEQTDETGFVTLTVRLQANPLREVDANGELVEEYPSPAEPGCVSLTLLPDGPDDAYRIHNELPLTGCPPGS